MKILLIEDNFLSGLILKELLLQYGECDLINNGIDGVNKYIESINNENPYDIICLDIIMPIYSGYQLLEQIRDFEKSNNMNKCALIIMTSSLDNEYNKKEAYRLGADAYLIKPIKKEDFEDIINNIKNK